MIIVVIMAVVIIIGTLPYSLLNPSEAAGLFGLSVHKRGLRAAITWARAPDSRSNKKVAGKLRCLLLTARRR